MELEKTKIEQLISDTVNNLYKQAYYDGKARRGYSFREIMKVIELLTQKVSEAEQEAYDKPTEKVVLAGDDGNNYIVDFSEYQRIIKSEAYTKAVETCKEAMRSNTGRTTDRDDRLLSIGYNEAIDDCISKINKLKEEK